ERRIDGGVWNCGFRNDVGSIELKEVHRWTRKRALGWLWPSGRSDEDVSVREQRSGSILRGHPTSIKTFWKSGTDRPRTGVGVIDRGKSLTADGKDGAIGPENCRTDFSNLSIRQCINSTPCARPSTRLRIVELRVRGVSRVMCN